MWVPASAGEVEAAVAGAWLVETATFDAKREVGRSKDVAIDVCAMTVDGGVLLYGVGEDEDGRLAVLSPLDLAGLSERVDQVVQTSISESPFIETWPLPLDGEEGRGYLAVVVPQSPRAPHQVTVGGDLRFYGRGATGNRILAEGDIARLYERRRRWEVDRDALLDGEVARSPYEPVETLGFMHAFVRPVTRDPGMLSRAGGGEPGSLLNLLSDGLAAGGGHTGYVPDVRQLADWRRRGAEGWMLDAGGEEGPAKPNRAVRAEIDNDGTAHLFCGRVADTLHQSGRVIFETIAAGNLASVIAMAAAVYERAGYVGHVDLGVAIRGVEGALSDRLRVSGHVYAPLRFNESEFRETARVSAAELVGGNAAARALLRRFTDATTGNPDFDPLG